MDRINFLNIEYIYLRIVEFFRNFDIVAVLNSLISFIEKIRIFAIIITIIIVYFMIYSIIRLRQIEKREEEKFRANSAKSNQIVSTEVEQDTALSEKWMKVQGHINSDNPAQWRLAILEADIMLGDVLEKMGYQGDSIGDKLKSVDKSDFLTLNSAWDAHKVRNQIAHEGTDFQLNEREAKRVIELYKAVFSEFYHI